MLNIAQLSSFARALGTPRRLGAALAAQLALCLTAPAAQAQEEADLSWYEGGKPAESAPREQSYEGGADAELDGPIPGPAPATGWGFGLAAAYVLPAGDFSGGPDPASTSKFVKGALRPALDAHYFFHPSFGVGAYAGLGFGLQGDQFKQQCGASGVDCKLYLIDTGVVGEYRLWPGGAFTPWIALNLGYEHYREVISASQSAGGVTVSADGKIRAHGFAFGTSIGIDLQRDDFGIGPYIGAQFGSYRSLKFDFGADGLASGSGGGGNFDKAMHYYLQFGLRGRYEVR